MTQSSHNSARSPQAASSSFLVVKERAVRGMDQMLGYHGRDRFVVFYYEPRGEEVIWRDSHSYGFATGAWLTFMDEVVPVADLYKVDVGQGGMHAKHVLFIDRKDQRSYFADQEAAFVFLERIAADGQTDLAAAMIANQPPAAPPPMLEITQETIARLAYEIWESEGRPEGQGIREWLQAEARLKASLKR